MRDVNPVAEAYKTCGNRLGNEPNSQARFALEQNQQAYLHQSCCSYIFARRHGCEQCSFRKRAAVSSLDAQDQADLFGTTLPSIPRTKSIQNNSTKNENSPSDKAAAEIYKKERTEDVTTGHEGSKRPRQKETLRLYAAGEFTDALFSSELD